MNDYSFHVSVVAQDRSVPIADASVVLPYYETGALFKATLLHLADAIAYAKKAHPHWSCEVIVVDDGSRRNPAERYVRSAKMSDKVLLECEQNVGRSAARNTGLACARHPSTVFLDADVLVTQTLLAAALRVVTVAETARHRSAVAFALFEFAPRSRVKTIRRPLTADILNIKDFRESCIYEESWIGCADDTRFVGEEIHILHETDQLQKFPYKYKAWVLPNMVLGGFFVVNTRDAVSVGGFDPSFTGHGFTETTLVTKLVAARQALVMPLLGDGAIHIELPGIGPSRAERNRRFRLRHKTYFDQYLRKAVDEACSVPLCQAKHRATRYRS